jgi:hypothetical protein
MSQSGAAAHSAKSKVN